MSMLFAELFLITSQASSVHYNEFQRVVVHFAARASNHHLLKRRSRARDDSRARHRRANRFSNRQSMTTPSLDFDPSAITLPQGHFI
ncbi:hypothetical protein, partial [Burkholderia sp. SIMBA_062]|uniref:hypothetical protein n=1 Tax=Burkholderia sp. SIMBA_062 TaxID=3085803 RepID=UPI00397C8E85